MKKIIFISTVFVIFLAFFNQGFTGWKEGEVKSSPLFQHSLNATIDRMENQGKVAEQNADGMATTEPNCVWPNKVGETEYGETCEFSCGGGSTCASTCTGPTCGTGTTCEGTCTNTCVGGSDSYCINARFYGTMKWKNTYWNWPSNGSTSFSAYLSPSTDLIDYDMWFFIWPYGGGVSFDYGSGYGSSIQIALFDGFGGGYDDSEPVPRDLDSFQITGGFGCGYESIGYQGEADGSKIINHPPYSSNNIGTIIIEVPYQ